MPGHLVASNCAVGIQLHILAIDLAGWSALVKKTESKLVKSLAKKIVSFFLLAFGVAIVMAIAPGAGAVCSLAIFGLASYALFVRLPRIGLGSRVYSFVLALFFGLLSLGLFVGPTGEVGGSEALASAASVPAAKNAEADAALPSSSSSDVGVTPRSSGDAEANNGQGSALTALAMADPADDAASNGDVEGGGPVADVEVNQAAVARAAEELQKQKEDVISLINEGRFGPAKFQVERLAAKGALDQVAGELEAAALTVIRPIPADELELNRDGYLLLASIMPVNSSYRSKAEDYAERIVARRNQAVSILRTKEDRVEGITFYLHPNQPRYYNSRSTAYLYIGRRGVSQPWLRMQVQYTSNDWLFVQNVYAWHDGIKELLISGPFESDSNTTIWEWRDVVPDGYQLEVLRSLATAKEAILRFEGMQYRRDVTLSAGDKRAILDVLAAYAVMSSGG